MKSEFKRLLLKSVNKVGPSDKEKNNIHHYLSKRKEHYLSLQNNNQRLQEISNLDQYAGYLINTSLFKNRTALQLNNEHLFGKNPELKLGQRLGSGYSSIISEQKDFTVKDGEVGYMMPNMYDSSDPNEIFMSTIEIEDYIDNRKIDIKSKNIIGQKMTDLTLRANNTKPGQIIDFDFNKEKYNIKNNIVEDGNLSSLINDEMFAGRVFKDDLIQAIMTASYEDLGISLSEEEIKQLDPTDDGKVSFSDAMVIFSELMNDKERAKDYVAEYFTKFAEQNFNNNLSKEVTQANEQQKPYDPYEFA